MTSRTRPIALLTLLGVIAVMSRDDSVAWAATITKVTGTAKIDAAVGAGIQTFWSYALGIIPIIGVAAIVFGLWNAVTTDRGQSSSIVSGLTTIAVGLVIALVPIIITSTFTGSGSEAASLGEMVTRRLPSRPIDWDSPITLLIIMGFPIWRVFDMARRTRRDDPGVVAAA